MKFGNTLLLVFLSAILFAQSPEIIVDFNQGSEDAFNRFNYKGIEYDEALIFPITNEEFGEELAIIRDGELSLLKDINEGSEDSSPTGFVKLNDKIYFGAKDAENGSTLWVSDGTVEGTTVFFDPDASDSDRIRATIVSQSGKLYFTYGSTLYVTDGNETEEIFTGVYFPNFSTGGLATLIQYEDEIAFLQEIDDDHVELFGIDEGVVVTLASSPLTSSFPNFYGLCEVEEGLLFTIDDPFKDDADGTFFYDKVSGDLDLLSVLFEEPISRRNVNVNGKIAVLAIGGKGYYSSNGFDNQEQILFESEATSFVQGNSIESASFDDNFIFATTQGTFYNDQIIHSDGTTENTKVLFEVSQYTSNMLSVGKFAFFVSGTSNNFKPELYKINMEDGAYELIHAFTDNSLQTSSVLLVGALDNKLYFISNLDPSVGREMYSIDVNLVPSSLEKVVEKDLIVEWSSQSFKVNYPSQSEVSYKLYNLAGVLLSSAKTRTNVVTDLSSVSGMVVIEIKVDGLRQVRKIIGVTK